MVAGRGPDVLRVQADDHQSVHHGAGCDDAWTHEGVYGVGR